MKIKSREDFVDFWARYVRDNPKRVWQPQVKALVDSQIIMANRFYQRLAKTKDGRRKIKLLRNIKNK